MTKPAIAAMPAIMLAVGTAAALGLCVVLVSDPEEVGLNVRVGVDSVDPAPVDEPSPEVVVVALWELMVLELFVLEVTMGGTLTVGVRELLYVRRRFSTACEFTHGVVWVLSVVVDSEVSGMVTLEVPVGSSLTEVTGNMVRVPDGMFSVSPSTGKVPTPPGTLL